jgi:glycerol-3-phosphate acyltransferase PlsY
MAVAGHNWPVFLGFKGGKGVATTVGGLLGIIPAAMGLGLLMWTVIFLVSRYVSLASILAALAVCVYVWLVRAPGDLLLPGVMTALAVLIVWRHKTNIVRLANGSENRFSFGKRKQDGTRSDHR